MSRFDNKKINIVGKPLWFSQLSLFKKTFGIILFEIETIKQENADGQSSSGDK